MVKTIATIILTISISATCIAQDATCRICDRVEHISGLIADVSTRYWSEFGEDKYRVPLFYFTDSNTYMMLTNKRIRKHFELEKISCANGYDLYKSKRIDDIPFRMENKMDISKKSSPYYREPVMYCSDAETAHRLIPEVTNTEEWMAIVFHEYFHGFQFRHKYMMDYMADTLQESADTLIQLYRKEEWFRTALGVENDWLLKAINTESKDSVNIYIRGYLKDKTDRRNKFKTIFGYDITNKENFWEKVEGTARYVEYHLSYIYNDAPVKRGMGCDSLFGHYQTYKTKDFESMPWMTDKVAIMPAYYYVTGFNMCRLLDKLGVKYKDGLFDSGKSLEQFLAEAVK